MSQFARGPAPLLEPAHVLRQQHHIKAPVQPREACARRPRSYRQSTSVTAYGAGKVAACHSESADMLASLRGVPMTDAQPGCGQGRSQHDADCAVDHAKQTLMNLGYSVPLKSGVRDRFCMEGGLDAVVRLLQHPELQYLAMSALTALLGSRSGDMEANIAAAMQADLAAALVPLLAPGTSWVIQGRCCGVLSLLIRQELRSHTPHQDQLRQGVRWELLDGGAVTSLTSLLTSKNMEAQHQASTTLWMLTRFGGAYHQALLLETNILSALVDFCVSCPHNILFDMAAAVVNLCDTDCVTLQKQIIAAGAVRVLLQMQSLSYRGPFQEAARCQLRSLATAQPEARQQILSCPVVQPPATQPQEWTVWWEQLRNDLAMAPA